MKGLADELQSVRSLSLCSMGALFTDGKSVNVDKGKCSRCQKCIKIHMLSGGCIIRNYSPKRASLLVA